MTPAMLLSTSAKLSVKLRPHAGWLVLGFAPLAGLGWSAGHVLPSVACASLSLALLVVGSAGAFAQRLIDGLGAQDAADHARTRPGVFQLLWLGQYALLALSLVLTLPAALLADLTGWTIPLRISLPAILGLGLVFFRRRLPPASALITAPSKASLPLAALVAFAAFRALSLHGTHAGALGHDTQQHVYWTQHILDYGFLPLTSRGSDLLDPYPKLFHLLVACWSAAGLSDIAGIYVKMMPFLQAALACGFLCELFAAATGPAKSADGRASVLPILMGVFLCWHLTLGDGQEVYRVRDLSGTPRYSAGWILFTPPLLALAHRVGTFRDARPWLFGSAPALGALALGVNPVSVALLASYSLPLAGVLYLTTRDDSAWPRVRWVRAMAIGCCVAIGCLLANHFVINSLASFGAPARILHWLGVRTTAAGVPIDIWIPREGEGAALCRSDGLACAYDIAQGTLDTAGRSLLEVFVNGTPPGLTDGKHSFWYWAVFAAPLVVFAFHGRGGATSLVPSRQNARIFLGVLLASAVSAALLLLVRAFLMQFEALGPLWALLAAYYRDFALFLGTWLRCLLPVCSWIIAPSMRLPARRFGVIWGLAAVACVCLLSAFKPVDLVKHRYVAKKWRIDWPELRAIRHLNEFVPKHETVLITGQHWVRRNREHLLIADDPLGMIVPHLTTRLLFGIGLGSGIDYTWADLDQTFCGTSIEARQRLLREVNARWVLARDDDVRSKAAFDRVHWECGVKLRDLAAEYPPAWSEADLALYRISP